MSIDELETKFGHEFALPRPELDARFVNSGVVDLRGPNPSFAGRDAGVLVYEWRGFTVSMLQGRPGPDFDLHQTWEGRDDVKYLQLPDGEAALRPRPDLGSVPSFAAAYRSFPGWLVGFLIGPPSDAPAEVSEFEPLVGGVEISG